jgi:branched-chain amino acid transport system permease protein
MSTFVLIFVTSLGLAGLYFLLAAGLSLIFGLMDVLNLAHGAFYGVGGYAAWWTMQNLTSIGPLTLRFAVAVLVAAVIGVIVGAAVERLLIARNYGNHLSQILITIGLSFVMVSLLGGIFTFEAKFIIQPDWFVGTVELFGAKIPNNRLLILGVAAVLFVGLTVFLRYTRHGLIIRAGVENRDMVSALGIDVGRSFTLVFAIGGMLAAIGGALGAVYFNAATPTLGSGQLIFGIIVIVIGGLGSINGTAVAAVLVALTQQFVNYYVVTGLGDIAVVALLAVVLLIRPQGLLGGAAR